MIAPAIDSSDHYLRMSQAAFNCSQTAWTRRDEARFNKAAELHRKYVHKWKQALAREARATAVLVEVRE